MTEQLAFHQFQQLPDNFKQQALDFISYLFSKHKIEAQKQPSRRKKSFRKFRSKIKPDELAEAIRIVKMGCDMSTFGDALEYQIESRQDRELPFRN